MSIDQAIRRLHKIALEVMPDPQSAYTREIDWDDGFFGGASYLSCMGESIGLRKADSKRMRLGTYSEVGSSPTQPFSEEDLTSTTAGQAYAERQAKEVRDRSSSLAAEVSVNDQAPPATNDGGKVRKPRRQTASAVPPTTSIPRVGKRPRGFSNESHTVKNDYSERQGPATTTDIWTQDAGEAGVWTICSTEISRHTFYIPPVCFNGRTPYKCKATGSPDTFLTPIPSVELGNLPSITKITPAARSSELGDSFRHAIQDGTQMILSLYGENLGPEWTVWL